MRPEELARLAIGLPVHAACIASLALSWRYRNEAALARLPALSLFILLALLFCNLLLTLWEPIDRNPATSRLVDSFSMFVIATVGLPYAIKTWVLYFRFCLAESLLQRMNLQYMAENSNSISANWFVQNGFLIHWKTLLLIQAVPSVFCIIIASTMRPHTGGRGIIQMLLMMVIVGFILFILVKLRKKNDVWGFKLELIRVVITGFVALTVYVSAILIPRLLNQPEENGIGGRIASVTIWISFLLYSMYGTPRAKKSRLLAGPVSYDKAFSTSALNGVLTIEDVLNDKELHDLFKNYLQSEFAVENIAFIDTLSEFKAHLKEIESLEEAEKPLRFRELIREKNKIIYNFIRAEASTSVNISSEIRAAVLSVSSTVSDDGKMMKESCEKMSTMFTDAEVEIVNMLSSDSLRRFAKSKLFKDFQRNRVNIEITVKQTWPTAQTLSQSQTI